MAAVLKPEFIFRRADGGKVQGTVQEYLFKRFVDAEKRELELWEDYGRRMQELFERFSYDERRTWLDRRYEIEGVQNGLMSKKEMIMVALNSGNAGNRTALREGWGWNDATIKRITDQLSQKEWKLVTDTWKMINDLWPLLDDMTFKLTGTKMRKVEGIPVETPYGVVEGQYFPLTFDYTVSRRAARFKAEQAERDYFESVWRIPATERGMTIQRTGGKLPPLLDFSVIQRHLFDTIHHITHGIPIRDADRLLRDPKVRNSFEERMGKDIYAQLRPWLQHMAKPKTQYVNAWERQIDLARNRASTVVLGLKASVAAKQIGSYTQTIDALGLKPALEGLSLFYRNPRETYAYVNKLSTFMRNRGKQWDREVIDIMKTFEPTQRKVKVGKYRIGQKEMNDAFFSWIMMMDKAATYPTWWSAFRVGMERYNGNQARAVEFADTTVRTTQPTASPKDLSAWQRGGVLMKLLTPFYTFFNVFANRVLEKSALWRNDKIGTGELMVGFMWLSVIPGLYAQWASDSFSLPKDSEEAARKALRGVLGMTAGGFPIIRDVVQPIIDYATTGSYFQYEGPPVFEAIQTPISLGVQTTKVIERLVDPDEDLESKDYWNLYKYSVDTAGYWMGLPSKQILVTSDGLLKIMRGETQNPAALILRQPADETAGGPRFSIRP